MNLLIRERVHDSTISIVAERLYLTDVHPGPEKIPFIIEPDIPREYSCFFESVGSSLYVYRPIEGLYMRSDFQELSHD